MDELNQEGEVQYGTEPQAENQNNLDNYGDDTNVTDLASAFSAIRAEKQATNAQPMGEQRSDTQAQAQPAVDAAQVQREGSGEPSRNYSSIDNSNARQRMAAQIQYEAQQKIASKYKEIYKDSDGDPRWFSENLRRARKDGTVMYINPEGCARDENGNLIIPDPDDNYGRNQGAWFASRNEADQWCNAENATIQRRMQKEYRQALQEVQEQYAPQMQLLAFEETYSRMSKQAKDLLDDMVEGYEVYDSNNNVIGFRCDMNRLAQQAMKMASRFESQQPKQQAQPQQQQRQASGPALDTPSRSGQSSSVNYDNAKDLNDVFRMMAQERQSKR